MSKRNSLLWEFLRKSIHLSGLLVLLIYTLLLNFFSEQAAILTLTGILLILLEIEYIRIEHKPKIANMFSSLFRKHEKNQLSGAVFFVISCIIVFAAFEYWVAMIAMFMTVFGDLVAALMGRTFGKKKLYRGKTWIGTLSGLVANVIVGALIVIFSLVMRELKLLFLIIHNLIHSLIKLKSETSFEIDIWPLKLPSIFFYNNNNGSYKKIITNKPL